jgi:hypothetical protein
MAMDSPYHSSAGSGGDGGGDDDDDRAGWRSVEDRGAG